MTDDYKSIRLCLARISYEIEQIEQADPCAKITELFESAVMEIDRISEFSHLSMQSQREFVNHLEKHILKVTQRNLLEIHLYAVPYIPLLQPWSTYYLIIQDYIELLLDHCPDAKHLLISISNRKKNRLHLKLLSDGILSAPSDKKWLAITSRVRFYHGKITTKTLGNKGTKVTISLLPS